MLNVGTLTQSQSTDIFKNSDSIKMLPVVSAEWNHNLFNPPYITVAGTGTKISGTLTSGTVSDVVSGGRQGFTTKSFAMADNAGSVSYTISGLSGTAYKVVTYIKTDSPTPVMINTSGKGSNSQFGSEQVEASSIGWTKVITYVGSSRNSDTFSSFVYKIVANSFSETDNNATVMFTVPEIYQTTLFDYQYGSLWPTDSPFTYFRPGESYVSSGDVKCSFGSTYRRIASKVLHTETMSGGFYGNKYMPLSPIIQNPSFFLGSPPVAVLKNALPTDISPYQYFVSDDSSKSITAIYEKDIVTNKIVIKFNTLMTSPTFNLYINGSIVTVDSSTSISMDNSSGNPFNGLLTLYWTGSAWSKIKWTDMPKFDSSGAIAKKTTINKITITQINKKTNPEFLYLTGETAAGFPTINSFTAQCANPDTGSCLSSEVNQTQSIWALFNYSNASSYKITMLPATSAGNLKTSNANSDTDAYLGLGKVGTTYSLTLTVYSENNQLGNSTSKTINYTVNPTPTVEPLTSSQDVISDLERMQLIEISPRLEVDLSDFVQDVNIDKSLDANNTSLPISSINSNDATIVLSGIPGTSGSSIVPIFSSQSDNSLTILSNMMKKNVKFYVNFNLIDHVVSGASPTSNLNTYIPAGVFYSDSWQENDIQTVTIQTFDISRYLQSRPVPDYVVNLKTVFEIITNILDLAGFTDYDYDSLYEICNSKTQPLDIAYYYCNSKDSTILSALNEIFVAYQIGAYIDEYGVMKFLSLHKILTETSSSLSISEAQIEQGGVNISNTQKPGKISLRYQTPKVKQSPALQNVKDPEIKKSPAFIYTTSNDVVWQQQTIDSVGFNYLNEDMLESSNMFSINNNDLLDIFHTFNMDTDGYVAIEQEIVSFEYKQYTISSLSNDNPVTVSIKNNLELASEINRYIKQYTVGLKVSNGSSNQGYDIKITPTGKITNVQRGMFGTSPSDHNRVTTLASKNLVEKKINSSYVFSDNTSGFSNISLRSTEDTSLPNVDKLGLAAEGTDKTAVGPFEETDIEYKTYSAKFELLDQYVVAAGLFINQSNVESSTPLFVELIKYSKYQEGANVFYDPPQYRYILAIYDSSDVYAWTDVTGECRNILNGLSKVLKKTPATQEVGSKDIYSYVTDNVFNLKVVLKTSNGSDGENATENNHKAVVHVYLNGVEIEGWQVPGFTYVPALGYAVEIWTAAEVNSITGNRQKPVVPDMFSTSKNFGFYTSVSPIEIPRMSDEIVYPTPAPMTVSSYLREIHATEKPLLSKNVNYFYQTTEFLNGLVQKQRLASNSLTYLMQTTPEIVGINYYDVQYTTPAAVSVDVLPIEYMMTYFPGNSKTDQQNKQKKLVTENSLSYSTPINTGFRARMAIANNSPHMVFLTKESDDLIRVTVNLNLWTHEIVAPSDQEIIETVVDQSNIAEVVQLDSEWIQSKSAANKMIKIVEMGLNGFSVETGLNIFGNPLIQIGDVVTLSYNLNGISQQKHIVTSVSHSFNQGLTTTLRLNRLY
jgi:hypothetical protein